MSCTTCPSRKDVGKLRDIDKDTVLEKVNPTLVPPHRRAAPSARSGASALPA